MSLNSQRVAISEQKPNERTKNFNEVILGYSKKEALVEASRCLNCKNAPCIKDCPVNINISGFIKEVAKNNIKKAYSIITENNSLPGVCGRVCPQELQCQKNCTLGIKGDSIAIGNLERYVADNVGLTNAYKRDLDKKVAVIGSGPASLACAGQLLENGLAVYMYEALHSLGGVLRYGIPEFRLPKQVIEKEISDLTKKGLVIEKNIIFGVTLDIEEVLSSGFEAIFLGLGAGSPKALNIPGEYGNGVYSANEFLTRVNLMKAHMKESDTPIYIGKDVLIIGGGNVALDAARVAKRLTTGSVKIIYRRQMKDMPAREVEIKHTLEEQIEITEQLTPVEIKLENGWVKGLICNPMIKTKKLDSSERRIYIQDESSEIFLEADTIIIAIGQIPNPGVKRISRRLKLNSRGTIEVDKNLETNLKNVYAGGDITTGAATVINAISAGKRAAESIIRKVREV